MGTDASADYNPFDPDFLNDPQPVFERVHREAPVSWNPLFDSWLITKHEDLVGGADAGLFAAHDMTGPSVPPEVEEVLSTAPEPAKTLYQCDGPMYERLRALVVAGLSPEVVAAFEPTVRRLAGDLVDGFAADGQADLVSALVTPLTNRTILDFVGIPEEDHERIRTWSRDYTKLFMPGQDLAKQTARARSVAEYARYHEKLVEDRRKTPREDLTSALIGARAGDHEPLTTPELVWELMELTAVAGNATYGLANVLLCLLRDRGVWEALRTDPSALPAAVEEGLRLESPVLGSSRTMASTADIGGVTIEGGTSLLLAYAAANRDEAAFRDPHAFQLRRAGVDRHLTMGRGAHACVGAQFARLEIVTVADLLLERLPDLALEDGFQPSFTAPFPFLRCVAALPARWST